MCYSLRGRKHHQKAVGFNEYCRVCAAICSFPTARSPSQDRRAIRRGRNGERIVGVVLDDRQETLPKRHRARPVVKLGSQCVVGSVLNRCQINDIVRSHRRSRRRQRSNRNTSHVFHAVPRQGDVAEITNRRRPGVDLRRVIELHLVDCAPTGESGHVKDHRGRCHVHADSRRAGRPRSITEAILEPGIDRPEGPRARLCSPSGPRASRSASS